MLEKIQTKQLLLSSKFRAAIRHLDTIVTQANKYLDDYRKKLF